MDDPLEATAKKFDKARSGISRILRGRAFGVHRPPFLVKKPKDGLNTLFENLDQLWATGVVSWGAVVEANNLLFKKGTASCPALAVYSLEDPLKVDRLYLLDLAHRLYDLKGTKPENPGEALLAEKITDEMARFYGIDVPGTLSPELSCKVSVTFFERKNIPGQILVRGVLPFVVCPREPFFALPLPKRFWDSQYKNWWLTSGR